MADLPSDDEERKRSKGKKKRRQKESAVEELTIDGSTEEAMDE